MLSFPFTVTSALVLKKELFKIRIESYGSDFQEARLEVARVAAPVFGADKKLEGVIDVAGPFFRMNRKTKLRYAAAVKKYAESISKELGYEKY
jgi:DNA-binding IclR family transcriptional regulator